MFTLRNVYVHTEKMFLNVHTEKLYVHTERMFINVHTEWWKSTWRPSWAWHPESPLCELSPLSSEGEPSGLNMSSFFIHKKPTQPARVVLRINKRSLWREQSLNSKSVADIRTRAKVNSCIDPRSLKGNIGVNKTRGATWPHITSLSLSPSVEKRRTWSPACIDF